MTGCLADSPSPVPLHVCFHRGFDWTSLSLAAGRKRDPETAKDPPPWQPGCMFETTSFRSEMISVDCHPSNSVYEITSVCVCVYVRESVCQGGVLLTLLAPDACTSNPFHPQQSTHAHEWISHAIRSLHSCTQTLPAAGYPAIKAFRLCVNALRAMCLPF